MGLDKGKFAATLATHQKQFGFSAPIKIYAERFIRKLLATLFPQLGEAVVTKETDFVALLDSVEVHLHRALQPLAKDRAANDIVSDFLTALPEIYQQLLLDVQAIDFGDPAATGPDEVIHTYPGFLAIAVYRIAHALYKLEVPLLPRILTEYAHERTGIDIHPAAAIGPQFCIDHGTGIVIGATSIIERNVRIYQGVTLGGLVVKKQLAGKKRHPTIEENVIIYANATILGGDTVIGKNSIIGGNVWLTTSVPPNSIVYHEDNVNLKRSERSSE